MTKLSTLDYFLEAVRRYPYVLRLKQLFDTIPHHQIRGYIDLYASIDTYNSNYTKDCDDKFNKNDQNRVGRLYYLLELNGRGMHIANVDVKADDESTKRIYTRLLVYYALCIASLASDTGVWVNVNEDESGYNKKLYRKFGFDVLSSYNNMYSLYASTDKFVPCLVKMLYRSFRSVKQLRNCEILTRRNRPIYLPVVEGDEFLGGV